MDFSIRLKIRETYKDMMPWIERHYPRVDPYIFDFFVPLSPIEENVWGDIRYLGLPMLMQFPVDPYFIDFADPIKKMGIEVDGREFHQDVIKDDERQRYLEERGWTIIRIEGNKTTKGRDDFFTEEIIEYLYELPPEEKQYLISKTEKEYRYGCSEGILLTLREKYYEWPPPKKNQKILSYKELINNVMKEIEEVYRNAQKVHRH